MDNKDFFDLIASDYDEIVSFAQSVEKKKESFKSIFKPWMKTAADLGCGSGTDSIALSSLGLKVTAFDPSPEMIKVAEENAEKENQKINFHTSPIHSIPESFNNKFDIVVSLGNTFANIERKYFTPSIKNCFELLKPDGTFIIQILNYEKILSEQKRIVNIREGKKNYFIRFYDFKEDEIIFNILVFNKNNPTQNKLLSTTIYPYVIKDFSEALGSSGFEKTEFFADLNLNRFEGLNSLDLFIIAHKG